MAYEREHRLDNRALLERPADELERPEVETAVPGKQTRTEELDRIALASASPKAGRSHPSPGRHAFGAPKLAFHDFRALALRDVLSRLEHRPALRDATLAAADPNVARRVAARTVVEDRKRTPRTGEGMWRAAERRAVTLYRRALATGTVTLETPAVTAALQSIGCGVPLDPRMRAKMERILGVGLDRVRLHTGSVARDAANAANAEAFTVGEDIFLPAYNPESIDCQRLLLHELVHCCQWWQGRISTTGRGIAVSQPGEALEREAETVVARAFHDKRDTRADAADPLRRSGEPAPHNGVAIAHEPVIPAGSFLAEFQRPPGSSRLALERRGDSRSPVAALHPTTPSGAAPLRVMRQAKSGSEASPDSRSTDSSESDILQSLADLRRSLSVTPAQWQEVGGQYVQFVADNWELICGVIACFFTVEWASKKFAASKNYRAAAMGHTFLLVLDLVALGLSLDEMKGHAETAWNLAWNAKGSERQIYQAGIEWARMAVSLVLACVAAGASLRNLLKALKLFKASRAARTEAGTARSHAAAPSAGDIDSSPHSPDRAGTIEMTWNEERELFEFSGAGSARTSPAPATQSGSLTAASTASSQSELEPVYVAVGSAKGGETTPPDKPPPAGLPKPDKPRPPGPRDPDAPPTRTPRNPNAIIRYPNGEVARVNALGELNTSPALRNPGNGLPGYTDVAIHGDPLSVDAMRRAPIGGRTAAEARRAAIEGARAQHGLPTIAGRSIRNDLGIEEWTPEHLARVLTRIGVVGPIRLISCNTGALGDGFAARLAWHLKTVVLANPEIVEIDETAGIATHSGWFRFEPVEGKGVRRSLSLQTWQDRSQFSYFARFVEQLQTAPYRLVLNQAEAPAVRARSYREDMRAISNLVGADLGLFVETAGRHHVILQRATRTGAPLSAPPGTRELYRVTSGEDVPSVSDAIDRTIKQHLKAAESGRRTPARSTASSNEPPALRSWSDVKAPASELQHLFKHYFERSEVDRRSTRAELFSTVRQLLLEVGLSESTWTVISKISDEKLRTLVEAEHFLPAIASIDRKLHSVVEWLAYAYASDRITVADYQYHLENAAKVARLPVATLLSTEPSVDGSTLLFEARRDSEKTFVRVPLGSQGPGVAGQLPTPPNRMRVRIFDLNRRIWIEAQEAEASALPRTRDHGPASNARKRLGGSAAPDYQNAQRQLQQCFRDYYVNPHSTAHAQLFTRVHAVLANQIGVSPTMWRHLQQLSHSKLSTLVTSREFLQTSSDPKLHRYIEPVIDQYASNHNGVPPAVWMFYLREAEAVSQLEEVTDLVPFDRGQGNRASVFRGALGSDQVLVKISTKIAPYDLVGDDLLKLNSLQRYEAGPRWGRRVRIFHPEQRIYRQALAMEPIDGYSVKELRDLQRQNMELPFRVTEAHIHAVQSLQSRLKADTAHLQDVHAGNVLLTHLNSRLVALVDIMVLHGSRGLDGDVSDLSAILADVIELEQYSRRHNDAGPTIGRHFAY